MMKNINYDLHIHSCLSPCGDSSATPAGVAGFAALAGLDIAALADHNTAKNTPAFERACRFYGVAPLSGIEVTAAEEIHVLCLFETSDNALAFGEEIDAHRAKFPLREDIFGTQVIMDEDDCELGRIDSLLTTAADISFNDLPSLARKYHGVAVPAHIDKASESVISSLGVIPPEAGVRTVELFSGGPIAKGTMPLSFPLGGDGFGIHTVMNSDAHILEQIGINTGRLPMELPWDGELSTLPKLVLEYLENRE